MTPEKSGGEGGQGGEGGEGGAGQTSQPNEGWEQLRRTAEEALQYPSARTAPVRTRATTWLLLALIVACVVAVGIWVPIFFAKQAVNGQRIKMRQLEEKAAAYQAQVDYTQANGHMPDGVPVQPLTDAEARELQELERKFGVAPATRPAPPPASHPAR